MSDESFKTVSCMKSSFIVINQKAILKWRAEKLWEFSILRFTLCPLNLRSGPSIIWSWENKLQKTWGEPLPSQGVWPLFLCLLLSSFSLYHIFINPFSKLVLVPPWRSIFLLNGKTGRRGQNKKLTLNLTFCTDAFLRTL